MTPSGPGASPTAVQRTLVILWAVLLASQLVYAAIALSGLSVMRGPGLGDRVPAFAPLLAGVAVATAVLAHVWWRRGQVRADAEMDPAARTSARFGTAIVTWAIDESVGVYGLLLALTGHGVGAWAPFAALAFALFSVHRPFGLLDRTAPPLR